MEEVLNEVRLCKPDHVLKFQFLLIKIIRARHIPKMELLSGNTHSYVSIDYISPCDGDQEKICLETDVVEGLHPEFLHSVRVGPVSKDTELVFRIMEHPLKHKLLSPHEDKLAASFTWKGPFTKGKHVFTLEIAKHHHASEHSKHAFLDIEILGNGLSLRFSDANAWLRSQKSSTWIVLLYKNTQNW